MTHVLAHIVGVNTIMKKALLPELQKRDIYVQDVDELTGKMRKDKELIKLDKLLNTSKDKRAVREKIKNFWTESLEKSINAIDSKKKIVLVGFTNYHKNYGINININAPIKIFINTDPILYAKQVIENNLDKYRQQIIDNTFPINYLRLDFLQQQRERLLAQYRKRNYLYKTKEMTIKILDVYLHKHKDVPDLRNCKLFMASTKKYETHIPGNKINAYTEEWLALVSMPEIKSKFKKGFDILDNKKPVPFVQELEKNAFNAFDVSCYLYQLDTSNFKYVGNIYKFQSTEPAKIVRRIYVLNLRNKIHKKRIKMLKFR